VNRRGWLSWLGSAILISIPLLVLVGSSIGYVFFIVSISHHLGSWEWIFWSVLSYAFLALIVRWRILATKQFGGTKGLRPEGLRPEGLRPNRVYSIVTVMSVSWLPLCFVLPLAMLFVVWIVEPFTELAKSRVCDPRETKRQQRDRP
jgi:hypothetical protein